MSFIYSASGKKIPLELSTDDIGVRFEDAHGATVALRAMHAGTPPTESARPPRGYQRMVMLHQAGAARSSFATVRDTLSRDALDKVQRILPVFKEPDSGLRMVITREIIVRFRPRTSETRRERLLRGHKVKIRRQNGFVPRQYTLEPVPSINETVILDLANTLSECDEVEYATPNFVSEHRRLSLNDPLLSKQWHLHNSGAAGATRGEDVKAFEAWKITGGNRRIVIAVVDDGVDIDHPDLRANIWTNPNRTAPDQSGRNFYDNNYDPRPHYFTEPYDHLAGNDIHGTPCAGVAAACGDNAEGGAGIAYKCRILPVKIFGGNNLASNENVANAIRYAGSKAQVISCSWEAAANADLESAIADVVQGGRNGRGCLLFCATGNNGLTKIAYPARYGGAIATGASNDIGRRSAYSNYGEGISFVAPSSDAGRQGITTTDVSIADRGFDPKSAYTDAFGGTSSATPLAAGIGALVLSLNPSLTRDEVFAILRDTADRIDIAKGKYRKGYSKYYGYGRLNAFAAVTRARPAKRASKSSVSGPASKKRTPGKTFKKPGAAVTRSNRKKPNAKPIAATAKKSKRKAGK